jgi:uncharacterized protein
MGAFSPLSLLRDLEREAREACQSPDNRFGPEFFEEHVIPVREKALMLSTLIGADAFCVEAASYLHDIAVIRDFSALEAHERHSADAAVARLRAGYVPEEKIRLTVEAIAGHSRPVWRGEANAETVCVSNADAMATIAKPVYWLRYAFLVKGLGYRDGAAFVHKWFERGWNDMIDEARTLCAADYSAAHRVLASVLGEEGVAPEAIEL